MMAHACFPSGHRPMDRPNPEPSPCMSVDQTHVVLPNAGPRSLLKDGRKVESAELSRRLTTAGPIRWATARRLERLACHSSQVQSVLSLEGEFTFHLLFQLIHRLRARSSKSGVAWMS